MATGWAGDGAVSDQISQTIADAVERARREIPKGQSLYECEDCGEAISEGRRKALPGVRLCLDCQKEKDKKEQKFALYNRKGSKDSQIR